MPDNIESYVNSSFGPPRQHREMDWTRIRRITLYAEDEDGNAVLTIRSLPEPGRPFSLTRLEPDRPVSDEPLGFVLATESAIELRLPNAVLLPGEPADVIVRAVANANAPADEQGKCSFCLVVGRHDPHCPWRLAKERWGHLP